MCEAEVVGSGCASANETNQSHLSFLVLALSTVRYGTHCKINKQTYIHLIPQVQNTTEIQAKQTHYWKSRRNIATEKKSL